jgi:hypothetical protein
MVKEKEASWAAGQQGRQIDCLVLKKFTKSLHTSTAREIALCRGTKSQRSE